MTPSAAGGVERDHQGDQGAGRDRPRRHRPGRHRHRVGFYDHMLAPARPARRLRPDRAHRRATWTSTRTTRWRTPRSPSGAAFGRGAGRQGRHPAVRRRDRPDGRGAGAGRGRPVRPAVRGARRAGRAGPVHRGPVYSDQPDPAHLGVVRPRRPDHAARERAAGRPGRGPARTRTTWWRPSSRRSPGRCARRSRIETRGGGRARAPRACCDRRVALADRAAGLAGILLGGAYSLYRQGAEPVGDRCWSACSALLGAVGGVLWLLSEAR